MNSNLILTTVKKSALLLLSILIFVGTNYAQNTTTNGDCPDSGASDITCDGSFQIIGFDSDVLFQDFTIPADISEEYIFLKLRGGDGGKASVLVSTTGRGGEGADIEATFVIGDSGDSIPAGSTLRFIIGQKGRSRTDDGFSNAGTGGGGSAVFLLEPSSDDWELLMVAGGGGGGWANNTGAKSDGRGGRAGESGGNGKDGITINGGNGGSNGRGGGGSDNSGGGGGAFDAGNAGSTIDSNRGGNVGWQQIVPDASPNLTICPEGGDGGCNDDPCTAEDGFGFGGGGWNNSTSGGGGGGYSGGGGGGDDAGGGGGGSYVSSRAVAENKMDGGDTGSPNNGRAQYICFDGPSASCVSSISRSIGTEGDVVLTTGDVDNGSSGDLSLDLEISTEVFTCDDIGTHTVTLTVTDEAGLTATCSTTVTISDEAADFTEISLDSNECIEANGSYTDLVIPSTTSATSIFIEAVGGDGGRKGNPCGQTGRGGKGAEISALFKIGTGVNEIPPGSILRFIPGKRGDSKNGSGIEGAGGGGGSGVLFRESEECDWTLLIVAGGGGGGYSDGCVDKSNGQGGRTSTAGGDGRAGTGGGGNGGTNGGGGNTGSLAGTDYSGGGGGANQAGSDINCTGGNNFGGGEKGGTLGGDGGQDGPSGCGGGREGGYGYGGGGLGDGSGGGGGGYSGGGGGGAGGGGGGGGSYINTDYQFATSTPILSGGGDTGNPDDGFIKFRMQESIPPVARCVDEISLTVNYINGNAVTDVQIDNGSSDEDGSIVSTTISPNTFDCADIGIHTVTYTVTDNDGLSDNCQTQVTVQHTTTSSISDMNDNGSQQQINANGNYTDLLVPEDTEYSQLFLFARGADGGRRRVNAGVYNCTAKAGQGADAEGKFTIGCGADEIPPGSVIRFIPGKKGSSNGSVLTVGAGGGGGSGILMKEPGSCDWVVLVVAGGGGGAFASGVCQTSSGKPGEDGRSGSGGKGNGSGSGGNGATGNGGNRGGNNFAAAGGGAHGNGENILCTTGANFGGGQKGAYEGGEGGDDGSGSCPNGENGGFGFGGGGLGLNAGGGGGGWAGGGSGGSTGGGGGGGSYVNTDYVINNTDDTDKRGTDGSPDDGFCRYQFLSDTNSEIDGSPTASCSNVTATLNEDGEILVAASQVASGSSDDCTPSDDLIFSFVGGAGRVALFDCDDVGANSVTVSVTDYNGNTATCSATINIQEDEAPEAVCEDETVTLSPSGTGTLAGEDVDGGSTDNCSIESYTLSQSNFTTSDIGTTTVTLTVEDGSSNTATCTATITIEQGTTIEPSCKNATVNLDGMTGQASITTSDIDNGSTAEEGIASLTLSQTDFDCSHVGNNTVTLLVTDNMNSVATCTGVVTVVDNTAPMASCQNASVSLDIDGNGSIMPDQIDNSSSDVCGIGSLSLDQSSFTCANIDAAVTVTLTVTDANGNTSTCSGNVTVASGGGLSAICQSPTVALDDSGNGTTTADEVDDGSFAACSAIANLSIDQNTFTCADVGTNPMVTLTVMDNLGNTATCTTVVNLVDEGNPTAACQDVTVQLDAAGVGILTEAEVDNGSSDLCGMVTSSLDQTVFSCSDVGTPITVTLTVEDENDNFSECTSTITVEDNVAPSTLCQNQTVVLNAGGSASLTANEVDNGSSDACGAVSLSLSQTDFDCSHVGSNTVTLTVTDVNSNTNTCSATVTVQDNMNPLAVCQDVTVQLDAGGSATLTPAQVDDGSSDVCLPLSFSLSEDAFDCSDVGMAISVTLTVTDNSGNTSTCSSDITVEDNVLPTALCQDQTVELDAGGSASLTASEVDNGSNDACGIASTMINQTSFDCSHVGDNTITLTVTDVNNNVNTCTANISVEDTVAPVAICQDQTVELDAGGSASLAPSEVDDGSNDACGIASLSLDKDSFGCDDVGANPVVLTVTDVNGNISTCSATVTVEDNIAPVAMCVNQTVQLDNMGMATIMPMLIDNGSDDACDIKMLEIDNEMFDCSNVGGNTVTLTVTDMNSNTSTCSATVTIEDNVLPMANCQNKTIELDAGGSASITPAEVDDVSWDACGIASLSLDDMDFDCNDLGSNTVTLTVTDNNSNVNTCTATITVEDNIAPMPQCSNYTAELDANGQYTFLEADVYAGGTDNCGTINFQSMTPASVDCSDAGTTVTVTVTTNDGNGNTATCTAQVVVEDNIPPVAVCLQPTIVFNGESQINVSIDELFDALNSSDNCDLVTAIDPLADQVIPCDALGSVIPVVVTVEDASGNTDVCTANITVDGLPCDWIDDGGIGCASTMNSSDYDVPSATYSLTADDCSPSFPYAEDQIAFVYTELCGDGQITALVTDVDGTGYAGVMMRDSDAPNAPMVAMGTNMTNRVQKQVRILSGYPAYPQSVLAYNQFWVRIQRTGNMFRGYASVDGVTWVPYINQQVFMSNNCLVVGLYVYSEKEGNPITATFEHVEVVEYGMGLAGLPQTTVQGEVLEKPLDIKVYPNPASHVVNIDLGDYLGQRVAVRVFNSFGQVIRQERYDEAQALQQLDLSALAPGVYQLVFTIGEQQLVKRVVVARE